MNDTVAAQNQVPVDIFTSSNIYTYRPRDLWLAYGIAAIAALFSMIMGGLAAWRNIGCYQNTFSTFVRVTNEKDVAKMIDPGDNGTEPLPKHISDAKLVLIT